MLTRLALSYFKCFRQLELPLGPLTLLTGPNATGKSSILQAIGLIHQSLIHNEAGKELILNGHHFQMGQALDVIDDVFGRDHIKIGLQSDQGRLVWELNTSDRRQRVLPISGIEMSPSGKAPETWTKVASSHQLLHNLIPITIPDKYKFALGLIASVKQMHYLSAERLGPQEVYPTRESPLFRPVGIHGEYAPWTIFQFGDEPITPSLCKDAPPTYRHQTTAWFESIFPGWAPQTNVIQNTNLINLFFSDKAAGSIRRPKNVGFGFCQTLPIICACLLAKPGDLVLIENPETHLHPKGQADIGAFLAKVANTGVQLLIETHSDHILNGIRLATKKNIIPAEDVTIHFFKPRVPINEQNDSQIISPQIDASGAIDCEPDGFFDQYEKDLLQISGLDG